MLLIGFDVFSLCWILVFMVFLKSNGYNLLEDINLQFQKEEYVNYCPENMIDFI